MQRRWRGRAFGPAIATILLAGAISAAAAGTAADGAARWQLVGTASDGTVVLRVPLPDGRFTLQYRNSLYGSPAAEHFSVTDDGRLALVELAATDAAILQEYYGAAHSQRRAVDGTWAGWWHAAASAPLELAELNLAATRHGDRTLVTESGTSVELWRVVGESGPGITLEARPAG